MRRRAIVAASFAVLLGACHKEAPPANEAVPENVALAVPENLAIDENAAMPEASLDEATSGVLRSDAAKDKMALSAGARWLTADTDLDGDGVAERLAYLIDPMYCGTGGCSLYVMRKSGGGWTVADEIGPAQLPVYRLPTRSGGWADLGVTIYGGGASAALMRLPRGKGGYPDNPTVAPATRADKAGATLLIADDYDKAVAVPKG